MILSGCVSEIQKCCLVNDPVIDQGVIITFWKKGINIYYHFKKLANMLTTWFIHLKGCPLIIKLHLQEHFVALLVWEQTLFSQQVFHVIFWTLKIVESTGLRLLGWISCEQQLQIRIQACFTSNSSSVACSFPEYLLWANLYQYFLIELSVMEFKAEVCQSF